MAKLSRSQALAWECLPSSSAWRSRYRNVKINLLCSLSHQAELGNRHSQTGVWERDKIFWSFMMRFLILLLVFIPSIGLGAIEDSISMEEEFKEKVTIPQDVLSVVAKHYKKACSETNESLGSVDISIIDIQKQPVTNTKQINNLLIWLFLVPKLWLIGIYTTSPKSDKK
jgi:hypothetical protein